jgi:hypothetical protein
MVSSFGRAYCQSHSSPAQFLIASPHSPFHARGEKGSQSRKHHMKTLHENGQGQSALEGWQYIALQDAFRAGGLLDLCPVEIGDGWQVSVSDDRGNVLESVTLQSEKQAKGLIDLLILTAEEEAE